MNAMPGERICIVLNPAFGAHLENFEKQMPVWVVQSVENDKAVADLRRSGRSNLTSFVQEDFSDLLASIDEHHPGWRELEIHGTGIDESAKPLMERFGGGMFTPFGAGFVFSREGRD
jgi:hypothetical protein